MFPIRHSAIFKSRWLALLWAAGIIWVAYDFAAPSSDDATNTADNSEVLVTDANGAPVAPDEAKQLSEALNRV
jgi:hypothetical protein